MANSSSAEESDNSYSSNHNNNTNNNNHNDYDNSDSDARGSGSDSEDEKPLASRVSSNEANDKSESENENGNGYGSESQSQDMSSQSIKRERSDSEDNDSDDEPLSKKLAKDVKKEVKSESEEEYSPSPKKNKSKVKKESKPTKRKKDSDDESDFDSEEEYKSSSSKKKKKKAKDSDYDDDDYSDYAEESKKKKSKTTKKDKSKKKEKEKGSKSKKSTKKDSSSSPEKSPKKKVKKEEDEEHIWKWWEEERPGEGIKWKTLSHKGPLFPPPYEPLPKNVKFYYNGKPMKLNPKAEEVAGFYARMLDHDYVTKDVFNKNFFNDWRKQMTAEEKSVITDLKKCNFGEIAQYYKDQTEKRKQMTKEEKKEIKLQNDKLIEEYGYCILDGHKQKIGNFKIEPPGLFRGRGEHPKMGKLKKRIRPEDVIINIGKKEKVPEPPPGHSWKEVRHDNTVSWLASWTENVLNGVKYIMLNPSSKLKSIKDWQKYEKARELKKYVDKIREDYRADFKNREMVKRQRAVALYFIDKLALRAGNEKEEGETADTVGCCSLRVEHIQLHDEKDGKQYVVDFDFLGKDSIRYENSVAVEKRVFKNLKHFIEGKKGKDDLFDRIDTSYLNKYLSSLMEGLTAKVFRTYNASQTLQNQLNILTKPGMSQHDKLLAYNRANRQVAILCNHQRATPKTFDKQMENLNAKIQDKKAQVKEAKKAYKKAKEEGKETDKLKKRLATLEDQLKKLEVQRTDKEENKQIALGTSKLNYLDPRITVAWCKKWDVDINKVYNKTQRDKFRWAIEMVGPEYEF